MAERLAYLEAVVGADVTQFRKGMRDIRNEVGFLSETMSGIAGLGRSLTFAFTTPVLALGTAAITAASGFQASMYNINSIAGLTADELDALGQKTLEFGARTRAGAQAASEALYTVFSAGITNVDDAFAVMAVATKTAEAGLADLTTTTEGLVAILLSYGDTSEEAALKASDSITRMVALGVGDMQTFMTALSSVVPTASAVGMEFEDLAADMAFLTQRGLSAARAGVSMNGVLTQMLNPTEAMSAAFSELGARGLPELIDQFGGVNEAIQAVIGTADGDVSKLFEMFNSIQARRAIGLFAEGQEAWQQTLSDFEEGVEGSTARAWGEQMKSFAASWDLLMSAVMGAGIAIGQSILPVLQPFVDGVRDLLLIVVDTNPALLGMGAAFLAVAAAIPPLLWLVGSMITPFGLVLAAVSALVVAFATDFMGITTTVKNTVDGVITELRPLTDVMQGLWRDIFPAEITMGDIPVTGTLVNPMDTISVEAPSSLWEIYESRGYADRFTWNAFMEAALAGGWDGAVIDVGELITIEGDPFESMATGISALNDFQDSLQTIQPEKKSLWANIADGVTKAWPAIQTQLGVLWTNLTTWIDAKGSEVINGIAGWFTAGAGSNVYTAFTALLNGDIVGAINAVVPTLGTTVATAIGKWDLLGAFPLLTASFSTLFTNVSSWILSTGIPLFFQGLGYLGGRLVTWFSEAFATASAWLSGGGASELSSAVTQYVQDGILTPFNAGFEQATGFDIGLWLTDLRTDVEAGVSDFITAITPLWDALNFDVAASGLQDLMDGVVSFADSMADADWSGLVAIGALLIFVVNSLGGAIASAGGSLLQGLGTSIQALVNAISAAMAGDFVGALGQISNALIALLLGVISGGADLVDALTSALNALFNLDIPSFGELFDKAQASLGASVDNFVAEVEAMPVDTTVRVNMTVDAAVALSSGAEPTLDNILNETTSLGTVSASTMNSGMTNLEVHVPLNISWTPLAVNTVLSVAEAASFMNLETSGAEKEAAQLLLDTWAVAMSPEDSAAFQEVLQAYYTGGDALFVSPDGWQITITDGVITTSIAPNVTNTLEGDLPPVTSSSPLTMTYDQAAQSGILLPDTLTGETASGAPVAVTMPAVALIPLSTSFASDIAGGTDVATIIAENFVPLEEAWVAMFAPEGAMQTTFNGFSTAVALGWTNIQTGINDTVALMNEDIPAAIAAFEGAKEPFIAALATVQNALSAAKDEANGLKSTIEGLLALEGSLNVTVTVSSGGETADGSHKTGLMSVPFDGYMAELHKGEMVLTKNEANQYRSSDVSAEAAMPQTAAKSGDTYQNKVTIQGNLTVDQMLFELKRRGIDLTKVK